MLKLVQISDSLPASFICDPSASFQPGMIAQLTVIGNQIMATVSNGTCPIGVIDDIKTKAFTSVSWNEEIIIPATGVLNSSNELVTPIDLKAELKFPNVTGSSFQSSIKVILNPINGVITFIAGTTLNFDLSGSGTPNAIRTIVNYTYQVANIPGDDSTLGSQRVTVWFNRMFIQTDQYETNQPYPLNANLYVSENGMFTTRKPGANYPSIAMVTAPPTSQNSFLELIYF